MHLVRYEKRMKTATEEEMAREDYVPVTESVKVTESKEKFGKERQFFHNRSIFNQATINSSIWFINAVNPIRFGKSWETWFLSWEIEKILVFLL